MRKRRDELTQLKLKELIHYDPETGDFTWRVTRGYQARSGSRAGYMTHSGYWAVGILGTRYYAHRLAWLYVYGYFPKHHTDHVDGDVTNNRIANLRVASAAENVSNGKHRTNNTSGVKGLYLEKRSGKWRGCVKKNFRDHHTTVFENRDEAIKALRVLREKLHGVFARHH